METVVYATPYVRLWQKADMDSSPDDVSYLGESRHPPATVARMSTRPKTPTGVLALCFLQMEYEP